MDILKKDNYRKTIFAIFLVLAFVLNVLAEEKQPAQALIDSYMLQDKPTSEIAGKIISELNQALALCTNAELTFRIEYRIGILYFKTNDLAKAVCYFEKISKTPGCPVLIKLCSLNMAGQIYRMQAKDDKALKIFEELIEQSQKLLTEDLKQANPSSVLKLAISAGFARAEIYQYNQEYDSAVAEYKRIATYLKSNKISDTDNYAPLILDRISQFYLIEGRIEDYSQTVIRLVEKYPDYYRIPIIKLEIEAVKLLKGEETTIDFPRGSFEAPVRLIALIKNTSDKKLKDRVSVLLKDISSRYCQSFGDILLSYHCAWLLDTLGKHKQAAEVLENTCKQVALMNPDAFGIAQVTSMLTDYGKLQQAVILGEENRYREALEIVSLVKPDPNDIHLLNLADSIGKALVTLKREAPKDVNYQ